MTVLDRIREAEAGSWGESPNVDLPAPKMSAQVRRHLALFGAPGIRDPDAPCPSREFTRGSPSGECRTDSHYMCRECVHAWFCNGCGQIEDQCECSTCERCGHASDDCRCPGDDEVQS